MDISLATTNQILAFDSWHLELLTKAFSMLSYSLAPLAKIIIIYYIIISFISISLGDRRPQSFTIWTIKIFSNLLILSILLGSTFGFKNSILSKVDPFSTTIDRAISFRYPGRGAQAVQVSAFAERPFSTFAYLDQDFNFAYLDQAQIYAQAAIELEPSEMTIFVVDASSSGSRVQKSLYLLNQKTSEHGFSRSLVFLSNLMTSIAYTISNVAQLNSLQSHYLVEYLKKKISINSRNPFAHKSFYFYRNIEKYRSEFARQLSSMTSDGSIEVIGATVQHFPGAVFGYSHYQIKRTLDPSIIYASKVLPMKAIVESLNSNSNTDVTTKVPSKFQSSLYDSSKTKVAPQLYIRTHMPIFLSECRSDLAIRPDSDYTTADETTLTALLNPCQIRVKEPIVQNRSSSSFEFDLSRILDQFSQITGLNVSNPQAAAFLSSLVETIDPSQFGFSTTNSQTCSRPNSLREAHDRYAQLLNSDDPELKAKRHCLEMGHNLTGALIALNEQAKENSRYYDNYRYQDSPNLFAIKLNRQYARAVFFPFEDAKKDMALTHFARSTDGFYNQADVSAAFRSILAPLKELVVPIRVKEPGVVENDDVETIIDPTLEAFQHKEAVAAAAATGVVGTIIGKIGSIARKTVSVTAKFSRLLTKVVNPLKTLQIIAALLPAAAVLLSYTIGYFTAVFGSIAGIATAPAWLLMMFGKAMQQTTASDEQRGDFSLIPFGRFLFVPVAIGLEIGALGAATAYSMKFVSDLMVSGLKIIWAVFNTYLQAMTGGFAISDPFSQISSAFRPFGIALGITMLPPLIHSLIFGQEYRPQTRMTFDAAMHNSFQPLTNPSHAFQGMFQPSAASLGSSAMSTGSDSGAAASTAATPTARTTAASRPTTLSEAASRAAEASKRSMAQGSS